MNTGRREKLLKGKPLILPLRRVSVIEFHVSRDAITKHSETKNYVLTPKAECDFPERKSLYRSSVSSK